MPTVYMGDVMGLLTNIGTAVIGRGIGAAASFGDGGIKDLTNDITEAKKDYEMQKTWDEFEQKVNRASKMMSAEKGLADGITGNF